MHHTGWTLEAGAPADVWALAQTPDGFLWLGTGAGLHRFDGVQFERVTSGEKSLRSDNILSLFVDRSGVLWAGFFDGEVATYKNGRLLKVYDQQTMGTVRQIIQDRAGRMWAISLSRLRGGVALLVDGRWRRLGPEWGLPDPGSRPSNMHLGRDGTLWVCFSDRLLRLPPGGTKFLDTGQRLLPESSLAEGPDGRLWLSRTGQGPRPLPDLVAGAAPLPITLDTTIDAALDPEWILFDRDGALWGSHTGGILRFPDPAGLASGRNPAASQVEAFSLREGLTSDIAAHLLEDAEGDVWLGTNLGVDMFRDARAVAERSVPVTARDGYRVAPAGDGSVLVATNGELKRIGRTGSVSLLGAYAGPAKSLGVDRDGTIWLGTSKALLRFGPRGPRPVALPAPVDAAETSLLTAFDRQGGVWVIRDGVALFRRQGDGWRRIATLGAPPCPFSRGLMVADDHAIWGYCRRGIFRIVDGRVQTFTEGSGLDVGNFETVIQGRGEILVAGDHGLARFEEGRFTTLRSEKLPILGRVSGIVQTAAGDTWINGFSGVARIRTAALDAAFSGKADPDFEVFTLRDGLPGIAQQDSGGSTASLSSDGRLWFETNHGVAWIDPARLSRNDRPPPVAIRAINADNVDYDLADRVRLPAGTNNVRFDYTALSLTFPERVEFRYRLLGFDHDWQNPGHRRQAFYTALPPGRYTFQVIASNNDGVWNRTGASASIYIVPKFWRTWPFLVLILAVVIAIGVAAYLLRIGQLRARFRTVLAARIGERERIARELHDTLLQGFQALVLRFQAVAEAIPSTDTTRTNLDGALAVADRLLTEGRHRILNLRSDAPSRGLPELLTDAIARLRPTTKASVALAVEGRPRHLKELALEEGTRMAEEALYNASRHAQATHIIVEVAFQPGELVIRIVDDGVGMDRATIERGRTGHFGLPGMRERAERLGATLQIVSPPGEGTRVEMIVPAGSAYTLEEREDPGPAKLLEALPS